MRKGRRVEREGQEFGEEDLGVTKIPKTDDYKAATQNRANVCLFSAIWYTRMLGSIP